MDKSCNKSYYYSFSTYYLWKKSNNSLIFIPFSNENNSQEYDHIIS